MRSRQWGGLKAAPFVLSLCAGMVLSGCGGGSGGGSNAEPISSTSPGNGTSTGGNGTSTGGNGTSTGGNGTSTGGNGTSTGGNGTSTGSSGTQWAAIQATRASGPAPLAVLFDATGTNAPAGSGDAFHQLIYEFDFGDDRGHNWAVSGQPKNTQRGGPLAAHVFDTPGTYVVRVRAQTRNGSASDASMTVTVTAPEASYTGTDTVCVSPGSNFAGCPAGALRTSALPGTYAGKRVLLQRGATFGNISLAGSDDNVVVGAYGSGAKPTVGRVHLGGNGQTAAWPDNVTILDLNITQGFETSVTASKLFVYRCDINTPAEEASQFSVGTAVSYYVEHGTLPRASYYWPHEIFVVENDIQGETSGDGKPNVALMGSFARSALLGNTINRATEHSVRMWHANKTVIAHNALGGDHYAPNPPGIRGALKVHSAGVDPYSDNIGVSGLHVSSSQIVFANNQVGTPTYPGSWLSGFAPQNSDAGTVEGVQYVIAENNRFVLGPHTSLEVAWRGRHMMSRGNTVVGGGAARVERIGHTYDPALNSWDGPYLE